MDFYSISHFDKNPTRSKSVTLQREIELWQRGQREWRSAAPGAKAFYMIGNHEDRLRKWLWRHPEVADLEVLKLPYLLGLASLGIHWEHDKGEQANLELQLWSLVIKHGSIVRSGSGYSARAELEKEKYAVSTMTGHTHRGGTAFVRTRYGNVIGQECFCLCRLDPEYVQHPDWQQGLVVATVTPDSLSIEPIPFFRKNGKVKAHWRGKEYTEA